MKRILIPSLALTLSAAIFATTACGDEPIRQSHDWGQPLKDFNNHTQLSEAGQPSAAPDSPFETWVQYLSGTDKDNTVDWDFYVTKWNKMRQWSRLPVPSCWEMHGFGRLTYNDFDSGEKGSYNYKFRVPVAWQNSRGSGSSSRAWPWRLMFTSTASRFPMRPMPGASTASVTM